jgi:hypothetical protein
MKRPIPCPRSLLGACMLGVLLWLSVLPLEARGEVSSDVRRYLLSVHQLVDDLEYERALEQLTRAKKVAKGPEDDVALSLYEGVILAELSKGRLEESDAAFKSALFLNPEAKLPLQVAPKVRRRFEAIRQQILSDLSSRGEKKEPLLMGEMKPSREPRPPAALAQTALPRSEAEVSGGALLRRRAPIPAVAGGVLVIAGGVSWGLAHGQKSKLRERDPSIGTRQDAVDVGARGRTYQAAGVGLLAAGVVGLGIATGMYLLGAPGDSVSLRVGTSGTSAFVSGRWP